MTVLMAQPTPAADDELMLACLTLFTAEKLLAKEGQRGTADRVAALRVAVGQVREDIRAGQKNRAGAA